MVCNVLHDEKGGDKRFNIRFAGVEVRIPFYCADPSVSVQPCLHEGNITEKKKNITFFPSSTFDFFWLDSGPH